MKVVVAGATGNQARGAIWYLLKQKDVSQIVAAARRLDKLKELVASLGDKRLVAKFVDLSDVAGAAEVFKGADVVVNGAYEGLVTDENYVNLELTATKAALDAGVNYTGMGGAPPAPEHLALNDGFKRKGILAILGLGGLTGLLQIMAAYAINKLDRAYGVDIKSGGRDLVPPEEHSRPLTYLDYGGLGVTRYRFGADSVSYEDGKLHYDLPRANPEVFKFREPIGAVTIAQTAGGALIPLAQSYPNIRHISRKVGVDPDFDAKITFLQRLGFFGKEPINIRGQMISPWEVLVTLIKQLPPETKPSNILSEAIVIVRGEEAGKEVEYTISRTWFSELKEDIPPATGLCAAIAAVMLCRGQIKGKGVLMPELCIPPDQFLDEFAKAGKENIEISRKVRL